MKLKRQKRHRRIVRFYTACFAFREPFKVLCDGTFIHHLVVNKISSPAQAITNTLGAPIKPFTTSCVIAELKSLGASFSESLQTARGFIIARCDHEKRKSAAACIEEVIGTDNSEHFFVCTQDTELREKFQEVPGVPVVFGLRNSLFLDPPSEIQREHAKKLEEKRLHVTESEKKILEKRGIGKVATETAVDAREGLDDQIALTQTGINMYSRTKLGVMDKGKFKRNKAKGPNPLSCKKKKIRETPPASKQDRKDDTNGSKKRNRKRVRSHKKNKPEESET